MAANPFRSFIAYFVTMPPRLPAIDPDFTPQWSVDPSGGQWQTVGLHYVTKGETEVDLGTARMLAVRFNERILPGKVRDEYLGRELKKLEQQLARAATRKEYAQLRDQVEFDLLPKAFIRRTVIPVAFYQHNSKDYMLIFTSSQKRADDVCSVMWSYCETLRPWQIQPMRNVVNAMTILVRNGEWETDLNRHGVEAPIGFIPADAAVFRGDDAEDKRTIRIKDKDIDDRDLKDGYEVRELRIIHGDPVEPIAVFTLNHNMVFKAITLPGVKPEGKDFAGFATICVQTYKRLLDEIVDLALGGMAERPEAPVSKYNLDDV